MSSISYHPKWDLVQFVFRMCPFLHVDDVHFVFHQLKWPFVRIESYLVEFVALEITPGFPSLTEKKVVSEVIACG